MPTTNTEEEEVEQFYEDIHELLEHKEKKKKKKRKMAFFIIGDWDVKERSQEIPGVTDKFGLGVQNEAGAKANKVLPSEHTDHSKHTLHQHKRWLTRWSTLNLD